jgi:hypothetical protein
MKDCLSSKDGKHVFEKKPYGLHCMRCFKVISVQEEEYDQIINEDEEEHVIQL